MWLLPSTCWCSTWIHSGRGTLPRTSKKLRQPSYCSSCSSDWSIYLRVQQGDDLAARRADYGGSTPDADLRCGDAHALAEHVHLGDALDGGLQLGDDPAGVLGFVRERQRAGLLPQPWVVDLDDAQLGHRLAGLLVGTVQ